MSKILFVILVLLFVEYGTSFSQTLQVALSSDKSKVDRSTSNGTATVFFDSSIPDLIIENKDNNSNESIVKVNDNLWFIHVNVQNEIGKDGACYRNFILKSASSADYHLITEPIYPNQVLYYTISLPNEFEPHLLEEKAKNIATKANEVADDGDSYLARLLALQALPPNYPYTIEAESALRKACKNNDAILRGHTESVESVSYSPNGKYIVSSSLDHTIRIWDANTGLCLHTLEGHSGYIWTAFFSPNSENIVSTSYDKTIRIWDVNTGKCLKILEGHTDFIRYATFNPDGEYIVSASYDGTIRIWNVSTGKCIRIIKGLTEYVNLNSKGKVVSISREFPDEITTQIVKTPSDHKKYTSSALEVYSEKVNMVVYSPDGGKIVSTKQGFDDNSIHIWDANTGVRIMSLKGHHDNVNLATFSPDGNLIVSASDDKTIRIWEIKTGRCKLILRGHNNRVNTATFSPDGKYVVSASLDNTIRIWDANTGKCVNKISKHTNPVNSAVFSPDSKYIVSASDDKTVRIWSIEELKENKNNNLEGHTEKVNSVVFSPNGDYVVSVSNDNTIRVWETKSGKCIRTFTGYVSSLTPSADGNNILSLTKSGYLCIIDSQSVKGQFFLTRGNGNFLSISNNYNAIPSSFISCVHYYASAYCDGIVVVWNKRGKSLKKLEGHTNVVKSMAFSPDDKYLITGSLDGTIRIWDVKQGKCLQVLAEHKSCINDISFSPEGDSFLSASGDLTSGDYTIRIWDSNTYKCLKFWGKQNGIVNSASFSPDGKYIISAHGDLLSNDNTVRIWDSCTGYCIQTLEGHSGPVNYAEFSPKEKHIVSASDDGTIRIWDFPPLQQLIDETRERFKDRQLTPEEKEKYNLE